MKGQIGTILVFIITAIAATIIAMGLMKFIVTSFQIKEPPPSTAHIDRQLQRDRIRDTRQKQRELMINQRQRLEDLRRMRNN